MPEGCESLKRWIAESIRCVKLCCCVISLKKLRIQIPPPHTHPSSLSFRSGPALWMPSFLQMELWPESHHTLYTAVFKVYPLIHSWGRGESNNRQCVEGDIFGTRFLKSSSPPWLKMKLFYRQPRLVLITRRNGGGPDAVITSSRCSS